MTFKAIMLSGIAALILGACGGSSDGSNAGGTAAASSGSEKGKVIYEVLAKKVESKGPSYCSIPMRLTNKTKRPIGYFKMGWVKAVTTNGTVNAYGKSIRDIAPGKYDEFSAAFSVKEAACDKIQKIIIEALSCNYADAKPTGSPFKTGPEGEDNCRDVVIVKGTKTLPFQYDENVRHNARRITDWMSGTNSE